MAKVIDAYLNQAIAREISFPASLIFCRIEWATRKHTQRVLFEEKWRIDFSYSDFLMAFPCLTLATTKRALADLKKHSLIDSLQIHGNGKNYYGVNLEAFGTFVGRVKMSLPRAPIHRVKMSLAQNEPTSRLKMDLPTTPGRLKMDLPTDFPSLSLLRKINQKEGGKEKTENQDPPPFQKCNPDQSGDQEAEAHTPPEARHASPLATTGTNAQTSVPDTDKPAESILTPLKVWEIYTAEMLSQRGIETFSPKDSDIACAQRLTTELKTEERVRFSMERYIKTEKAIYRARAWPLKFLEEDLIAINASKILEKPKNEKTKVELQQEKYNDEQRKIREQEDSRPPERVIQKNLKITELRKKIAGTL